MSNTAAYEATRVLLAEGRDFTSDVGSVSMFFGFLRALTEQGMHFPTQIVVRKSTGPAPKELS
jgi:DNA-binding LacI/PurR family transcriptional regulator